MEIVFIRHAKAEDIHDGIEDIDRQLTDGGKDKFAKMAVRIANQLKGVDSDKLLAWTSPATRAMETAEILVRQIGMEDLHLHNFIYEGNFDKLKAAVKEVNEEDSEATILLFGHEPTLSVWIDAITGQDLRMRKGMAASVKLDNLDPFGGEIQWAVEPE